MNRYIAGRVERSLRRLETTIGIVSTEEYATSYWQVGMLGKVKWIIAPRDLPGRCETDPPWHRRFDTRHDGDVEVIILQGQRDNSTSNVWSGRSLGAVVHIFKQTPGSSRCPAGWRQVVS